MKTSKRLSVGLILGTLALLLLGATSAESLIRNFSQTATEPASDDYMVIDGPTKKTRKMKMSTMSWTTSGTVSAGNVNATDGEVTNLTINNIVGTIPVANGGTGITSSGTSGNIITSNGTAWVSDRQKLPWIPVTSNSTTAYADSGNGWIAETLGNTTTTVTLNRTAATNGWTWSLLNVSANQITVTASSGNIILVGSGNVTGGASAIVAPSGLATFTMANATLVVAGSNTTVP